MAVDQQVMVIYAGTKGYMDDVPVNRISEFQDQFLTYVDSRAHGIRDALGAKMELTDAVEGQLKQALTDFKSTVWKK